MPSVNDAPAPVNLRLGDGAELVIELLPDGQVQRTRIEPNGTTAVAVVPRLQSSVASASASRRTANGPATTAGS